MTYHQNRLFDPGADPCLPKRRNPGGASANKNGRTAEATIYCLLKEMGYRVLSQAYIGAGIRGRIRVDVVLVGHPSWPEGLNFECKWQESSGTADEKIVLLVDDILRNYPGQTILVIDGGGARQSIVDYVKSKVDGVKLIGVMSLQELLIWVNANL